VGNNLKHIVIVNLAVHFALMQNEPKDQGYEVIGGGRGISATFDQWSTTVKACKIDTGRYDKRYPQIFQLPQPANNFKAGSLLESYFLKYISFTHNLSCRSKKTKPIE